VGDESKDGNRNRGSLVGYAEVTTVAAIIIILYFVLRAN
jgi:hypothetical protein